MSDQKRYLNIVSWDFISLSFNSPLLCFSPIRYGGLINIYWSGLLIAPMGLDGRVEGLPKSHNRV